MNSTPAAGGRPDEVAAESSRVGSADVAASAEPGVPAAAAAADFGAGSRGEREVQIVRSVRHGRIIVAGAVLGGVVGVLVSLAFPVPGDADYTAVQIAGFVALVGACVGLGLGSVLALLLGFSVRRYKGTGFAVRDEVLGTDRERTE